jgi:hypothetical protein
LEGTIGLPVRDDAGSNGRTDARKLCEFFDGGGVDIEQCRKRRSLRHDLLLRCLFVSGHIDLFSVRELLGQIERFHTSIADGTAGHLDQIDDPILLAELVNTRHMHRAANMDDLFFFLQSSLLIGLWVCFLDCSQAFDDVFIDGLISFDLDI